MVLLKTLNKQGQLMSVATKIGIQMSAKLGGEIWSVPIPVSDRKFRSKKKISQLIYYQSNRILVEKFDDHRHGFVSR